MDVKTLVLKVLASVGPVSKTKLMKLVFIADNELAHRGIGSGARWIYYKYGPFSVDVVDALRELVDEGRVLFEIVETEHGLATLFSTGGRGEKFEWIRKYARIPTNELVAELHRVLDKCGYRFGDEIRLPVDTNERGRGDRGNSC